MESRIKNEGGSALPMVLFITTALIILAVALSSSVSEWFKTVRNDETEECAYIAGQSAIETYFNKIQQEFDTKTTSDYPMLTDPQGAIKKLHERFFGSGNTTCGSIKVDVLSKGAIQADIQIKFVCDGSAIRNGDYIEFNIGIFTYSKLIDGIFSSQGSKKVFESRMFKIKDTVLLKPKYAICALGDIMADKGTIVNITGSPADATYNFSATDGGDIYSFGTAPTKAGATSYYYGGIYAKDGSTLNLFGNAFTQSLVRTGVYKNDDGSTINIYKDVVAFGIQSFGNKSNILINKNAYTFDDVEIDSVESIIGINGSYFGLSNGDGENHDSSSALLNSATVHNAYSEASKRSRIAVNGDVIIQGNAYKTDITPMGALEGGAVVWEGNLDDQTALPAYKNFSGAFKDYLPEPVGATNSMSNGYLWDSNKNSKKGFFNYIQWVKSNYDPNVYGVSNLYGCIGKLANFLSDIKTKGNLNAANISSLNTVDPSIQKITGYCPTGMAANNHTLYIDNPLKYADSEQTVSMAAVIVDTSTYNADYLEGQSVKKLDGEIYTPQDGTEDSGSIITSKEYWKNYWKRNRYMKDSTNVIKDFSELTPLEQEDYWQSIYHGSLVPSLSQKEITFPQKISVMRGTMLEFLRSILARRDFPRNPETYSGVTRGVTISSNFVGGSSSTNQFKKILDTMNTKALSGNPIVNRFEDDGSTADIKISSITTPAPVSLLCNFNPERNIVVDKNFKGLIFTVGKVVVDCSKSPLIEGAIIAAGKGFDPSKTDKVGGSAAGTYQSITSTGAIEVPKLPIILDDGSNLNSLNNGSYAAVHFTNLSGTGGGANIKYISFKDLVTYFKDNNVDLRDAFDLK